MLIKPYKYFDKATLVTPEWLLENNIKAVILDVDNTLTLKKGEIVLEGVMEWLSCLEKTGIKLIILSNARPKRMEKVSKKLGLSFVGYGMKPLPFGYFIAAKRMGVKVKDCAIIGDQLFTDMLGGNLAGVKTVLVSPKEIETSIGFKIKRGLERIFLKAYKLPCNF